MHTLRLEENGHHFTDEILKWWESSYFDSSLNKCVSKCLVIGLGNGLAPQGRQAAPETVMNLFTHAYIYRSGLCEITHWGRNKMAAIFADDIWKCIFFNEIIAYRFKFHWSLFPMLQLTIYKRWFRWWLGADLATSHYLNQWRLVHWRIYASLSLSELKKRPILSQRCNEYQLWIKECFYNNISLFSQSIHVVYTKRLSVTPYDKILIYHVLMRPMTWRWLNIRHTVNPI